MFWSGFGRRGAGGLKDGVETGGLCTCGSPGVNPDPLDEIGGSVVYNRCGQ